MRYSTNKDINDLIRAMLKEGWIVKSINRHIKLWHDQSKQTLFAPVSPSDNRAKQNFYADVRRTGFDPRVLLGHR